MTIRSKHRVTSPALLLAAQVGGIGIAQRAPRVDPDRNPAHLATVRGLWCLAQGLPGHVYCSGRNVAHHAGRHGVGQRCPDRQAVCLCDTAHKELHDHRGFVAHLSGEEIRVMEDGWIAFTQQYTGIA